jgi:hypothetical protein
MTTPLLTVDLDPADPDVSSVHHATLASLPRHFRVAAGGPADVAMISGRSGDWPAAVTAAIDAGRRAIVLTTPAPVALADVVAAAGRAAQADAIVAVETSYAGHRTWAEVRRQFGADAADASLLDSVLSTPAAGGGLYAVLLDQLAVVRPLLDRALSLEVVHRSDDHYVLHSTAGEPVVNLVGLLSPGVAASLQVDLVSPERHWRVRFGPPDEAAPIDVERHDAGGTTSWLPTYQTSRRQLWVDLHATLTGAPALRHTLAELAGDAAVADELLGQATRALRTR